MKSVTQYAEEYATAIKNGLGLVDPQELENARLLIKGASRIFVAGNGGSAAIADHLTCDFCKGAGLTVIDLTANRALLSALHNDLEDPSEVFSQQLEVHNIGAADLVILISASGYSANILEAARFARHRKVSVLGLTGFDGGELRWISQVSLHVPIQNYGVVEDAHQALMHILAQFIHLDRSRD